MKASAAMANAVLLILATLTRCSLSVPNFLVVSMAHPLKRRVQRDVRSAEDHGRIGNGADLDLDRAGFRRIAWTHECRNRPAKAGDGCPTGRAAAGAGAARLVVAH